jgi:dCMP deaminase
MISMRPTIDEYFSQIAKYVAARSTCTHRQVGAVLVRDGQLLASGFNGAPKGEPHCLDIGCAKPEHATGFERCRAVHAEVNAIIQAALHGVSIQGATLYCTHSPCVMCQRVLKNAGITKIVFSEQY